MTQLFPGPIVRTPGLAELDARARDIFRRVVESYLETGEPVGSRTISKGGVALSPASIRNTMQDLAQLGLLDAPHTSAGRMPTHAGLRMFVDGFLEVGDVAEQEKRAIEARLAVKGRSFEEALAEASSILSGLAGGAGIVVTPVREGGVKHVEFVPLGGGQVLAVMVFEDGQVENRLMRQAPGVTPSALQEASNFLNARLRGRTLTEARTEMGGELDAARRQLNETAARLVEDGLAAWSGGEGDARSLIVRGQANLLADARAREDIDRVRQLFDDLEQKGQLIGLLDDVRDAEGVRIYIGAETRLFSLSGSSVIAAPYMTGRQKVLGAIGVIGPARLNYARVIPLVDYTARVLGRMMDG
ncbi:heat-inducible transcriptional repressor HrcA [Caulobacter vibrioides]|uniref:Heat-inducible transcription repressor HrcA n=1 Tax=Caulobacter vibrioides (strain NA1000 / CB15N) TaxID=565050 RepID=HRCA_CAUVN|nr:heat-inducible transcriptional repressor HrcA [Caulobacter vibrioides]YP_002515527.1 winged helix-turn-helix transcription repressor HrcA [Caulobacter vibrioides NA1000]B8GXP3.1 RecName: Full=Heat-inducible transcription repressor HrcA [Caulobacter vibrioides NA1000]AAB01515.1 HrcA [Caulobacter vibrioides NA1000]ACL93619.1 winged helix-turn-helix transcription repressor HrcA [Caulobacter vibrioides NA1000]ATC23171.1 HrcA family transcriptional regulator [Caulobacter vibrioides]ATC26987.1 H